MRVISGTLKGRRLATPDWPGLRPTSDRLRETLFNILAPRIEGARVLDGYAGSGAVGIEALSRGAASVTFVDHDRRAIALIEANLRACGLDPSRRADSTPAADEFRYAIIRAQFADLERELHGSGFDIVFLDPPYGAAELSAAIASAVSHVGPDTLLVLEHAKRDRAPDTTAGLQRTREIVSGDSALAFYVRR